MGSSHLLNDIQQALHSMKLVGHFALVEVGSVQVGQSCLCMAATLIEPKSIEFGR